MRRAIGIIKGQYLPSKEMFNAGFLLATDGTLIDAVVLGRLRRLAEKKLDLGYQYLWVVGSGKHVVKPRPSSLIQQGLAWHNHYFCTTTG